MTTNYGLCGSTGNAWQHVYSYAFDNLSSRAEKTDIEPVAAGALDKVKSLQAVDFRWREGNTKPRQRGFIADEVAKVFGSDWGGYNKSGEHESIQYSHLVATLWAAVQELAAQVTELKGQRA